MLEVLYFGSLSVRLNGGSRCGRVQAGARCSSLVVMVVDKVESAVATLSTLWLIDGPHCKRAASGIRSSLELTVRSV